MYPGASQGKPGDGRSDEGTGRSVVPPTLDRVSSPAYARPLTGRSAVGRRPARGALPGGSPFDPQETPLARTRRARRMARELALIHPDAHCELDFSNAFELLVATVLSAQTTDKMVNKVTPTLFAKYPDAYALAGADREELEAAFKELDYSEHGGAPLLGVKGVSIISHGKSSPRAIKNAVRLAVRAVESRMSENIGRRLAEGAPPNQTSE